MSWPDGIDEYDNIVLAYPNYWGTMPMAVFTFLEKYDLSGKTILPLCTNEGSGMGHSEQDIAKIAKGATVKKAFQSPEAERQIPQALYGNGFHLTELLK